MLNTHRTSEPFNLLGKEFVLIPAPHLHRGQDWHTSYILMVQQILDELKVSKSPIQLPAYPLFSAFNCKDLRHEMGAYWEGALYYLWKIIDEPTSIARLRFLEFSIANGYGTLEESLFMLTWNSHGQLKWLKAHLIREDKQDLLMGDDGIETVAEREGDEDLAWLAQFVSQHEDEGGRYPNPYFGGQNPLHLGLILDSG